MGNLKKALLVLVTTGELEQALIEKGSSPENAKSKIEKIRKTFNIPEVKEENEKKEAS